MTLPRTTPARTPSFSRPLALLVAGTMFMEILDGTIIATAATHIAADLGVRAVDINLAMTAYLLTLAVGIPLSGWLADRFGARRVFLTAVALFTLASLLCAASNSLALLCAARLLQGLGGALMVPVGRLLVLRDADRQDFLAAIAFLTWPALLAPVLAPVLGGLIVSYASWEWIFLINLPLGVLAFGVAWRVIPRGRAQTLPPPDWGGFLLCAVTLGALVVGLELIGAAPTPWGAVVGCLTVATVGAVVTVTWLRRRAHPLLELEALRLVTFRVGNAGGGLYRLIISAVPFLLPLMFLLGFGWSALDAGLATMALFAGNVLIKPATTPLIRRYGFRTILLLSTAGGAVILAACAFLGPATPIPVIVAVLFLSGVLRSIGFSAYNTVQFADVPAAGMAGANTLSATVAQIATALGVAVGALLLRLAQAVRPDGAPEGAYQWTFAALALLMLLPWVEALRLPAQAGDAVRSRATPGAAPGATPSFAPRATPRATPGATPGARSEP